MIPFTYPTDSSGNCVVFEIDPTGLTAWVDYIPVVEIGTGGTYNDGGAVNVSVLADDTGETAWVDYIPVARVDSTNYWSTDDGGCLPVEVQAGSFPAVGFSAALVTGVNRTTTEGAEILAFPGETFDTGDYHDTVTNNSRLTTPADGYYHVLGQVAFTNGASATLRIYKNGSATNIQSFSTTSTGGNNRQISGTLYLAAGDYVELHITSAVGSAISGASTWFAIRTGIDAAELTFVGANGGLSPAVAIGASTLTAIPMNTEAYDTDTIHDTVTNNTRFTVPTTGYYLVAVQANLSGNGFHGAGINVDGSTVAFTSNGYFSNAGVSWHCGAILYLTAGQYIEPMGVCTNGGNFSTSSRCAVALLAAA